MKTLIALFAGLGLAACSSAPAQPVEKPVQPVVLELYQSQGCSSCPPANAVLNELASRDDVIALSFAVTYWDRLGWKDKFAQPAFTARQWDYANAASRKQVATPQLIVGGRTAILGSRKNEVERAIVAHRRTDGPRVAVQGSTVRIGAAPATRPADVWLVSYDPRTIAVPIRAGENGGRTLPHRNIVKSLTPIGRWQGQAITLAAPATPAGLSRAILVQSGKGGPIIAARRL